MHFYIGNMKIISGTLLTCFLLLATCLEAQEERTAIKDFLNQEIKIDDNFSGQSITLIKEEQDYFILRRYFGSGVPVIDSVKYKVTFNRGV